MKVNLDPVLIKAVEEAVREEGQPKSVADKFIAWLDAASKDEVTAEDESRRLDLIREALNTK